MNTCRVQGCRFSSSHVTPAHRCGVCNKFGHGEIECGNQRKINTLKELSKSDTMAPGARCTLSFCSYRWSHTNNAHHCRKCGERAHCMTNCPHSRRPAPGSIFSRWEEDSKMLSEEKDSDSESGLETNSEPEEKSERPLKKKKTGVSVKNYVIKCPVCKTMNVFSNPKKLFVDSECVICMDNKAQILFPGCSHVYVCLTCCDKLNEHVESKSSYFSGSGSSSSSSFFPEDDEGSEANALNALGEEEGKVYICVPAGMGCTFWYRRNYVSAPLERLFMHSDDWGQYGGVGSVPEHSAFIAGYRQIEYSS